jgi:glycosyltransferase involved in cell wall biosynthesis
MDRPLFILAPIRYPWRFNSPKHSIHQISVRTFAPLNYLSKKVEGFTIFNPLPPTHFDLIHTFNRIPISTLPFVIGFESHLPRAFGIEKSPLFKLLAARLASDKCRAIVATSKFASRLFMKMHANSRYRDRLFDKLHVRLPNILIDAAEDACTEPVQDLIQVVFVGNHFGRKGGCVTLRMAELAHARKLPILFHVISKFEVGAKSWTDPLVSGYFDHYRQLLSLPNVNYHGALPNASVISLIQHAHFAILATFSDTFGYSAIEAMAHYTPVIATTQGALPEFIENEKNGVLLELDTDESGEWIHLKDDRTTDRFAATHREEVERLAHGALDSIVKMASCEPRYRALRQNARSSAIRLFSATDADKYWDDLYDRAIEGVVYA